MSFNSTKRSKEAETKSRDAEGHFVKVEQPDLQAPKPSLINKLFSNVSINKTTDEDTLLDVHVGNPLHKIIELLKDIKKQKAFTFSIKGTLGVAGVLVVIAGAGVLGGMQSLCSKGVQSHIGSVRILSITEDVPVDRPLADKIRQVFNRPPLSANLTKRTILIKSDYSVISLKIPASLSLLDFVNVPVIATGNYDSCYQTLTIKDKTGVEALR